MVDEQLSAALRDLPGRVLNVPVEERQHLFQNVSSVLRNSEIICDNTWTFKPFICWKCSLTFVSNI
ncbi:uncharacterized protein LOC116801292 isoform X3 [Drosophila sechellia]|uniref:uncharacterized protein LOC116801292 isoform X3 n=1 Tax=Drosophila sechellia TaxID=7238 RepID=UPI0013DE3E4D|nr:uncharacterized protein LOC116801292 isoform X3 [Drosophila sechellia]